MKNKSAKTTTESFWRGQVASCGLEVRRLQTAVDAAETAHLLADGESEESEALAALSGLQEKLEEAERDQYNCACTYSVALRKRGLSFEQAAKVLHELDNAAGGFEVALNLAYDPGLCLEDYAFLEK